MARLFLIFIFTGTLLFISTDVKSQNSLNSGDFNGGSWGTGQSMSASAGGTLIITKGVTSLGDKYFRFYGDGTPCGEYQATTNGDFFTANTVVSTPNANCGSSNAWRINVPTASSNVVFKTDGQNDGIDKTVAFVIQGTVRSISSLTQPSSTIVPGGTATVSVTLDGSLSTGQAVWLRYSNASNFSSSTCVLMTGSGTSYSGTIPAGANTAGAFVYYYAFTSGNPASIAGTDADLFTINLINNGGSNYNYQVASQFYSKSTGDLNSTANWGTATDGSGTAPVDFAQAGVTYNIRNNATPTIGATWTVTGSGSKVIVGDGTNACTFTIPSGFSYSSPATDISNQGTVVNNRAAVTSLGTCSVLAGGTYQHNVNGGTIPTATWNASSTCLVTGMGATAPTGHNNQSFGNLTWNCTSQSADVTFNAIQTIQGTFTVNSTGAGSNLIQLTTSSGGAIFTCQNYVQNGGIMQIASSGSSTPSGLTVNNNFTLNGGTVNINNGNGGGSGGAPRITVSGNYIQSGGTLDLCSISTSYGATLNVAGNFTHTAGTIRNTANSTAQTIFLNGTTGTQTIESTGQTNAMSISVAASNAQCVIASGKTFTLGSSTALTIGNGTSNPDLLLSGGTLARTGSSSITQTGNLSTSASGGTISNSGTTTLTISNLATLLGTLTSSCTSSGGITFSTNAISGSSIGFTVNSSGSGATTISVASNNTGNTTISAGTLTMGVANALTVGSSAGVIQFNGGTPTLNLGLFNLGSSTASANSAGQLDFDVNTTINLGSSGTNKYYFKASGGQTWNGSTITINNWTGTAGSSGTGPQIFIGSDSTSASLTAAQLQKISFTGYNGKAVLLSTGEVVPSGFYYVSRQTGNWNDFNTWQISSDNGATYANATTGQTPSNADGYVRVLNSHTVSVTSSVSVDQVLINTGGIVNLSGAVTLTIADGTGTDLTVNGTFIQSAGTLTTTGQIVVQNGGILRQDKSGTAVPTATWNTGSTCEITGWVSTIGGGLSGQSFHNLTWNCTGQSSDLILEANIPTAVAGLFKVQSTGSASLLLANTSTSRSWTIAGDMEVAGGNFYVAGASSGSGSPTYSMTVNNFTQSGGNFEIGRSNLSGTYSFTVNGNYNSTAGLTRIMNNSGTGGIISTLTIVGNTTINGGTLDLSAAGSTNAGRMFVRGNFNLSSGSLIFTQALTAGSSGIYFDGTSAQTFTHSGGTISYASGGAGRRFFYKTASGPTALNEVYNANAAQTTINGSEGTPASAGSYAAWPVSGTLINNFTIANTSGGVTLSTAKTVNGTMSLTSGSLDLNALTLTVSSGSSQSIQGGGSNAFNITGAAGSVLALTGTSSRVLTISSFGTTSSGGLTTGTNVTVQMNANTQLDCGGTVGSTSMLTVLGKFQMNSGTASNIANNKPPYYGNASTLEYRVAYNVFDEWTAGSSLSTPGVPQHVTINASGATIDLSINRNGAPQFMFGDLTITAGTFKSNANTLNIGGGIANSGTFTHNNGTVNLNQSGDVNLNSGGSSFYNLTINKGVATNTVSLLTNALTVTNTLTLTSGLLKLGNLDLTLSLSALGNLSGGSSSSYIITDGTGLVKRTIPSGANTYLFPLGSLVSSTPYYNPASVVFATNTTLTRLDARFINAAPGGSAPSVSMTCLTVTDLLDNGYWSFAAGAGTLTSNFDVTMTHNGHTNAGTNLNNHGIVRRTNSGSSWVAAGTWTNPGSTAISPASTGQVSISQTTVGSLGEFAMGKGSYTAATVPTAGNNSRCGTGNITITAEVGAGETVDWYTLSTNGTLLQSGSSLSGPPYIASYTITGLASTTDYYAETRNTTTGCLSATRTMVRATINPVPTITLGASPSVCSGTTSANLSYSATTNSPNTYSITYDGTAISAGFSNVSNTSLPASPISLTVPPGASPATYNGTLTVNTAAGCSSSGTAFTVTVWSLPTASVTGATSVCSTNSTILEAAGGTQFNWDGAGYTTDSAKTFSSPTTSYSVYVKDANGCVSASPASGTITYNTCNDYNSTASNLTTFANGDNDNVCGFGNWAITTPTNSGVFLATTSNTNCNILTSNRAWGFYANSGAASNGVRSFIAGMGTGSQLKFRFDNNTVGAGGEVGFSIRNNSGNDLVKVSYSNGDANYKKTDNASATNTWLANTSGGVDVQFTLVSSTTYVMSLTRVSDGKGDVFTGTLANPSGGQVPRQLNVFNNNGGSGGTNDYFVNDLKLSLTGSNPFSAVLTSTSAICSGNSGNLVVTVTDPAGLVTNGYTVVYNNGSNQTVSNYTSGSNISVTPGSTTNYSLVSVTRNTGGCVAAVSGTPTITVNAAPTANAGDNNNTSICSSSTYTFTNASVSNNNGYTWTSNRNGTFSPNDNSSLAPVYTPGSTDISNGNATLTLTAIALPGCTDATSTKVLTITPQPSATISYSLSSCASTGTSSVSLTGTTGGTFSSAAGLTLNGTTGDITIGSSTPGTYTVSYTVAASGGCALYSTSASPVTLKTATWTGAGTSGSWASGGNWDCGSEPPSTFNVIIPGSASPYPNLTTTKGVRNISLSSGATMTVGSGGKLQVSGAISNSGGTFDVTAGSLEFNGTSAQNVNANHFVNNALHNLVISNSSGVTVANNSGDDSLRVTGTLSFGASGCTLYTGDNLFFVSSATGNGRVADITNSGANSGNSFSGKVVVERYHPAKRAWRLMTSPLTSTNTIYESWQNNGQNISGNGVLISAPVAGTGLDGYSIGYSLRTWDASTQNFGNISNTQVPISPGTNGNSDNIGYYLFVRGDRDPGLLSPFNTSTNSTLLRSKGNIQSGAQSFTAANSATGARKYTLIGNPFISPLNFATVSKTNLLDRFYSWDPTLNQVGAYVTVENLGGFYVSTAPGSTAQTEIIQTSQAFFVEGDGVNASASISMNESDKSSTFIGGLFRPQSPLSATELFRSSIFLKNSWNSNKDTLADANLAVFNDAYNAAVTKEDAVKFTNTNETFALLRSSSSLSIEKRKMITGNDTLFFNLTRTTERQYEFQFIPENMGTHSGFAAFLEDSYTPGVKTPVSLTDTTRISFVVNSDAASKSATRFRIVFVPVGPLPVTVSSVRANQTGTAVKVDWKVENQANVTRYYVERSADGIHFNSMSAIPVNQSLASGEYSWLDEYPNMADNFYRIKIVKAGGEFQYSPVVKVRMGKTQPAIAVYPNPVTGNTLGIQFISMEAGKYHARLINVAGQAIMTTTFNHGGGNATETVQVPEMIASGTYLLEIRNPVNKLTVIRVKVIH